MTHLASYSCSSSSYGASSFMHLAAASRPTSCKDARVFEPVTKDPAFVIGEQVAKLPLVKTAWRLASYFYSKLPSLELPGALAEKAYNYAAKFCAKPTGSYEHSCYNSEVDYLLEENECELKTSCVANPSNPIGKRLTRIRFAPGEKLALANNNGFLIPEHSRIEKINNDLCDAVKTAPTPDAAIEAQNRLIGNLKPGDVLTVDTDRSPKVIAPKSWPSDEAFTAFQEIAMKTGGIAGHSPDAARLSVLMEQMSAHILKGAEAADLEIAFVLDTTSSMDPSIAEVQKNIVHFLEQLQKTRKNHSCRVALIEYRDQGDAFLNRISSDFTTNLNQVQQAVTNLNTAGGGNHPEAVLDALVVAKEKLSWSPNAKRIVMLIGDAPPHPKTVDGAHSQAEVIAGYQKSGTQIAVYPIFSKT